MLKKIIFIALVCLIQAHLQGSYLISSSKELSLNTQSLHFKDINNKNNQDSIALSLGISRMGGSGRSNGDNTSNSHHISSSRNNANNTSNTTASFGIQHIGYTQAGKTQATLGEGEIVINGINNPQSLGTKEFKEFKDLNRDVNTIEVITQDKLTHALDVNTNIDMRVFTQKGREEIGNDFKSLPQNLIKSTIGSTSTFVLNPLITSYEVLTDKDSLVTDIPTQYLANQKAMVSTNNLNRNTINNLASGLTTEEIHQALSGENNNVLLYYDKEDNATGFYDNNHKQIYLNGAYGTLTSTKTFINTLSHEKAHSLTHKENIANNAGSYGNIIYSFGNALNFTHSHTSGRINPNQTNKTGINQTNKLGLKTNPIPQYQPITPKQWYQEQLADPKASKLLTQNTYQARLVNQGERDNHPATIAGGAAIGLEACIENPVGCAIIAGVGTAVIINKALKDEPLKQSKGNEQGAKQETPKNESAKQTGERKEDIHQPGPPNVDGKTLKKRKGNQGYTDEDGNIYQRDRLHNRWEKYDKKGNHLGEFDNNGIQTKPPKPGRKIDP
ncbi:colicin E3/pyocin S6 family cytotoxin [Helicobacter sp. 11S02596-1]|uniref:colicin E3/pyocin S6 family cytotoxin n=1 Tax=Helicobacter sp. 11S02596-1 TaxID=1476194 RepID=UPI001C6051E6|nr:colicin E3/pyocin S6 family cytotoxin [Helicobacter sp. 11S02596-1]